MIHPDRTGHSPLFRARSGKRVSEADVAQHRLRGHAHAAPLRGVGRDRAGEAPVVVDPDLDGARPGRAGGARAPERLGDALRAVPRTPPTRAHAPPPGSSSDTVCRTSQRTSAGSAWRPATTTSTWPAERAATTRPWGVSTSTTGASQAARRSRAGPAKDSGPASRRPPPPRTQAGGGAVGSAA